MLSASLPFIEVYIDAPLSVVEARDPKGLYKKARAGVIKGVLDGKNNWQVFDWHTIKDFTGISAPYEAPEGADIHIRTDQSSVEDSVHRIVEYLASQRFIWVRVWGQIEWGAQAEMVKDVVVFLEKQIYSQIVLGLVMVWETEVYCQCLLLFWELISPQVALVRSQNKGE
jgi:hypothetical protein